MCYVQAVSYTHLDVYKRQLLNWYEKLMLESEQNFVSWYRSLVFVWILFEVAHKRRWAYADSKCRLRLQFYLEKYVILPEKGANGIHISIPVSYTHLDVYKRQRVKQMVCDLQIFYS